MTNYIYIGGIHGVGKSFFCEELSKKLQIKSISASKVIFENSSKQEINKKITQNVDENISYLLEGLKDFTDKTYILDGHFVLLDKENNFVIIPDYFFESIKISKIILLLGNTKKILQNLEKRNSKILTEEFILNYQQKEINQAKYIASKYNIELEIINLKY